MIDLIVGCPVRQRNWILPIWREHVLMSAPKDVNVRFVFIVGSEDLETISKLSRWKDATLIPVDEDPLRFHRDWGNRNRYHHMVYLRNTLLSYVRVKQPDAFLSLDSDILLSRDTISQLLETLSEKSFDAVGGLTYLDRVDRHCTNIGAWKPNSSVFKRVVSNGVHEVDIIMAIKMMGERAYSVDYAYHKLGEDIGWSIRAKESGLTLGMDGRTPNKHIMVPVDLDRIDKRVGW